MSKSFKQFKKGDYGLNEILASPTNLQYLSKNKLIINTLKLEDI